MSKFPQLPWDHENHLILTLIILVKFGGGDTNISHETTKDSSSPLGNPSEVFKMSPELKFSDIFYFTSDPYSISYSWGVEMTNTNQISVAHPTILIDIQSTSLTFQPFSPSLIYFSLRHGDKAKEIFTEVFDQAQFPIFKNGHPNFRMYTILDWTNQEAQEIETIFRNHSSRFQLNNRLHILTNDVTMTDVYSIQEVQVFEPVGIRIYSITNPTYYTKYDFRGALIKATAVDSEVNEPVVTYARDSLNPKFTRGLGVFDLWDIRDMLNFSIQGMKGDDDISANISDAFKPTGIGLQLLNEEADVSILHTYILLNNVRHLKPLLAWGEDRVYAIFRQPPSLSVRNVFVKPFGVEVWAGLFVLWTGITMCIFAFGYLLSSRRPQLKVDVTWDSQETILWTVGAICQKSYFRTPGSISLRLLFLFSLYLSMATYASYSAQIISTLTAEVHPINSLTDLISKKFQLTSDPDKFFSYMLKAESQSYEEYGSKLAETYSSDRDSIRSLTDGFKMNFNTLDSLFLLGRELSFSDKEICQLFHYVPLGSVTLKSGFYVRKNSPFQEPFNLKIVIIMERGLNGRYLNNYYEETSVKCPKTLKGYSDDLGLADVFIAFAILIVGMVVACLVLGTELLCRINAGIL